MTAHYT